MIDLLQIVFVSIQKAHARRRGPLVRRVATGLAVGRPFDCPFKGAVLGERGAAEPLGVQVTKGADEVGIIVLERDLQWSALASFS